MSKSFSRERSSDQGRFSPIINGCKCFCGWYISDYPLPSAERSLRLSTVGEWIKCKVAYRCGRPRDELARIPFCLVKPSDIKSKRHTNIICTLCAHVRVHTWYASPYTASSAGMSQGVESAVSVPLQRGGQAEETFIGKTQEELEKQRAFVSLLP